MGTLLAEVDTGSQVRIEVCDAEVNTTECRSGVQPRLVKKFTRARINAWVQQYIRPEPNLYLVLPADGHGRHAFGTHASRPIPRHEPRRADYRHRCRGRDAPILECVPPRAGEAERRRWRRERDLGGNGGQ